MGNNRSIFLYPFSLIYGFIAGIRNFLFNAEVLRSYEFKIPVICVGNLAAGGTGKTPHTEYLAGLLSKEFKVAVLSRGYKRTSRGFRLAGPDSGVSDIGDEPLQMYRKLNGIMVAVDSDRIRGVGSILKSAPETSVIILDDGFQHRSITPGFSVLLTDFSRLIIRDHLLPYGNLRESASNMERADVIIVTKSPENISPIQRRIVTRDISKAPYQSLYFTSLKYLDPVPVFTDCIDKGSNPFDRKNECGIVLVTGISNPVPLLEYLGKSFSEIVHLSFRDHYTFKTKDIVRVKEALEKLKSPMKYIFTTEKDAVRLREFADLAEPVRSLFYYIPIGIQFLNDDRNEFDKMIVEYVRNNKRNNRVS